LVSAFPEHLKGRYNPPQLAEEIVERSLLVPVALDLVIGFVVYLLAVQLFFWQVPRRRHMGVGILIAFAGTLLGRGLFERLGTGAAIEPLGAALGALALVFLAVKVGTPGSVVLTIDTDGVTGHAQELAREGFAAPFVWPHHFNVEKYGSVVFDLVGKPGTLVTVEFPADNTPFGKDKEGRPRTSFSGTVPGRINASPVLVPSRGKYLIRKKDPDTGEVIVNDPSWDTPRRND
jgi:hypothetical protein